MTSLNKLTEWRRDVELIHCRETRRADLPSCHPETEHALCTNTVIFPLILGLYFCCNAKENRKNVSQLIHLEFLTLRGLIAHNLRVHFLNIYLSREGIAEHAPPAPLKHFAFRHYGDALCSCSIPQVITVQPCWTLLGFSCLARLLIVVEGQESIWHFRYPQRVFLAGSQI